MRLEAVTPAERGGARARAPGSNWPPSSRRREEPSTAATATDIASDIAVEAALVANGGETARQETGVGGGNMRFF